MSLCTVKVFGESLTERHFMLQRTSQCNVELFKSMSGEPDESAELVELWN